MIKTYFSIFAFASITLFGTQSNGFSSKTEPSKMHKIQQNHPDSLPRDQRVLMHKLSPKYQKIYISILTEDERDEVVEMYRQGENPYRVIDAILQNERKSKSRNYTSKSLRPKRMYKNKTEYMSYEQDPADDEDDYLYDQKEAPVCVEKKKPSKRERTSYKKMSGGHTNPSFAARCKSYYKEVCKRKKASNKKTSTYKKRCCKKRCKCSH
ncbi:MAG: hypothetical protein SP4CHLAM5_06970 [Chlamydiia bacterium]|nr:hypothetical protein [Chlamydiia bacterium]MCH9618564.1 hypothetical protein [Chlamydiia bacterium]MCH9623897.1 hypothetical protein [Chlamydiia bacterium]